MEQETVKTAGTCKIYKGIDTPCKIKGLLYRYFYMMFGVYGCGGLFCLIDFSSTSKSGNYGEFAVDAAITGAIVFAIKIYFTRMSNKKKIRSSNKRVYVSTRNIYKSVKI
ncbi:MAG: hypothetical protein H6Q13_3039 [Bacteroidetes bacterium]|nr:hypothetical protein [Bacteroidota bacterium]